MGFIVLFGFIGLVFGLCFLAIDIEDEKSSKVCANIAMFSVIIVLIFFLFWLINAVTVESTKTRLLEKRELLVYRYNDEVYKESYGKIPIEEEIKKFNKQINEGNKKADNFFTNIFFLEYDRTVTPIELKGEN